MSSAKRAHVLHPSSHVGYEGRKRKRAKCKAVKRKPRRIFVGTAWARMFWS